MATKTTLLANIKGPQGTSVADATIGEDGHLVVALTDGTSVDAGEARGPQGLPGFEGVPTDQGVAQLFGGPSATKDAAKVFIDRSMRDALRIGLGLILPPDGMPSFGRLPMPRINYHATTKKFSATLDYSHLIPKGGVTYYVAPSAPVAGNDGLSEGAPITIKAAIEKADVGEIRYAPGEYFWNTHGWNGQTIARPIRHIGSTKGKARVTGWGDPQVLTWTLETGAIYKTTRGATTKVADVQNLTTAGDYTMYEKKADLASITGPGQWATVGSVVYVWAIGSTNLTDTTARNQIRLQVTIRSGIITAGPTQYVENISFEGNANNGGFQASGEALIIAKDVSIKYATYGVQITDGALIAERVEVAVTATDGFSYHSTAGTARTEFIEIDCVSRDNGVVGETTANASTAHSDTVGIRVNGFYYNSYGPVIADVGSTKTWLLGTDSGRSLLAANAAGNAAYHSDAVGSPADKRAVMFVDRIVARNTNVGLNAASNGTIQRTTVENVAVATVESGVIVPFVA